MNPFSLFRQEIDMITLSDDRTSHVDKMKYLSVKNIVKRSQNLLNKRKSSMKKQMTISCFICQQCEHLKKYLLIKTWM